MATMAKIAFFKTLAIILLQVQGALTSDALVRSEASAGSLSHSSRVFGPGGPGGPAGLQLSEGAQTKSRPKRCTCYSYRDKECVYYCHLDIIWINTPERTVPYGMSSYQGHQRIRRSAVGQATEPRCICVHDTDPECQDFCLKSPVKTVPPRSPYSGAGPG